MQGRTENSIKNYFNSTVRKNIRRANKRLIFKGKLNESIQELMKQPDIYEFILCNALESEKMLNKLDEDTKLYEEWQRKVAAETQRFIIVPTIIQKDLINQRFYTIALREFYDYLTMSICMTNQL